MKTKLKTTLALLAAFCGLQLFTATPAFADDPTPFAVWDGGFDTTTKGVTTLAVNNNTVAADGSYVEISSSTATSKSGGIYFNNASSSTQYTTTKKGTVIFKVTGVPNAAESFLISVRGGSSGVNDPKGVYITNERVPVKINGGDRVTSVTGTALTANLTERKLAMTFNETGWKLYEISGDTATEKFTTEGQGDRTFGGCSIGAPRAASSGAGGAIAVTEGLKLYAVALFDSDLTAEQLGAYKFASEIGEDLSEMYFNRLSTGDAVVTPGGYGTIIVPGKGYKATAYNAQTLISNTVEDPEIGGSYANIIKKPSGDTDTATHTIAGWFKVDDLSSEKLLWFARTMGGTIPSGSPYGGYRIAVTTDGKIKFAKAMWTGGGDSTDTDSGIQATAANVITAGTWYHIALSITQASGRTLSQKLYVNGAVVAMSGTKAVKSNLVGQYCGECYIGAGVSAAGIYVDNNALAKAATIQALATNSKYVKEAPSVCTGTVTTSASWADLSWSPSAPTGGEDVILDNQSSADVTTVTIPSALTIGYLKILSPAGKELMLSGFSNLTVSSYNFSEAPGGVAFDVTTASWTASDVLKGYLRQNNVKAIFKGDTTFGATLDYGTTQTDYTFNGHYVFDGGTHAFQHMTDSSNIKFGNNATESNPTFWVKNGATLNWTARNPCGWSLAATTEGIVRIGDQSTVSITTGSIGGTWYWAQRFYFEPGSTLAIAVPDSNFRVIGGDTQATAQFYMPSSSSGTATISGTDSNYLSVGDNSYPKVAFDIGAGSTLNVSAKLKSINNSGSLKKYGAGTLNFTGTVSDFSGTIEVSAGTLAIPANQLTGAVTLNSGAVLNVTGEAGQEEYTITTGTFTQGSGTVKLNGADLGSDYAVVNNKIVKLYEPRTVYAKAETTEFTDATLVTTEKGSGDEVTLRNNDTLVIWNTQTVKFNQTAVLAGITIDGSGVTVTVQPGTSAYNFDEQNVSIVNGTLKLDGTIKVRNTVFDIGTNGDLDNYGWLTFEGEVTLKSDANKEVLNNTGFNASHIQGSGTIVKNGSGTITLKSTPESNPIRIDAGALTLSDAFGGDPYSVGAVTGTGTLTIPAGATLASAANTITLKGAGTVIATALPDGALKTSLTQAAWTGTLWVKNKTSWNKWDFENYGNANSKIKVTGVTGYGPDNDTHGFDGTLILADEGDTLALYSDNGYANKYYFNKLEGDGTFKLAGAQNATSQYRFKDASEFTGTLTIARTNNQNKRIVIGDGTTDATAGCIMIETGATATVASGKTWTVPTGKSFQVNGTLINNGSLIGQKSSGTETGKVTGTGTLVYDHATVSTFPATAPTGLNDANSWTGTVWFKGYTTSADYTAANFRNAGSKIKFTSVNGYFANNSVFSTLELENSGDTPAFECSNGYGGWDGTKWVVVTNLTGTGTLKVSWTGGQNKGFPLTLVNLSNFHGSLWASAADGIAIFIGPKLSSWVQTDNGKIVLVADGTAAIAEGKSWTAVDGIVINGAISGAGTLASATTFGEGAEIATTNGTLIATGNLTFNETSTKIRVTTKPAVGDFVKVIDKAYAETGDITTTVSLYVGDSPTPETELEYDLKLVKKSDGVYLNASSTIDPALFPMTAIMAVAETTAWDSLPWQDKDGNDYTDGFNHRDATAGTLTLTHGTDVASTVDATSYRLNLGTLNIVNKRNTAFVIADEYAYAKWSPGGESYAGNVVATTIDDSQSTGRTELLVNLAVGNLIAGADTFIEYGGTGTLTVGEGKKATLGAEDSSHPVATMTLYSNVAGGTIRFDGTRGEVDFATYMPTAGNYEFKNATVAGAMKGDAYADRKLVVQNGDTVTLSPNNDGSSHYCPDISVDVKDGGSLTYAPTESTWFHSTVGYTQSGGLITFNASGDGSATTKSVIFGYSQNNTMSVSISGGTTDISKTSVWFDQPNSITVSGTGILKVKGITSNANKSNVITVSDTAQLWIGSNNWRANTGTLTLNGGTLKAFENSTVNVAVTLGANSTLSAAAGKTLTIKSLAGAYDVTVGTAEDTGTVILPGTYVAAQNVTVKTGASIGIALTQQQMIDGYTASNVTFESGSGTITFVRPDGTTIQGVEGGKVFKPELPTGLLRYGYAFNSNTTKEADASTTLGFNGNQTYEDGVSDKALKLTVGQNYGDNFGFGGGDFTIVAIIKAPTDAGKCIYSVGGKAGTAGIIGLRTAGNNQIAVFTANGTDLITVTVPNATTQYHSYVLRYDNTAHTVALSVDGGAFTETASYTSGSGTQFQFGGIHSGGTGGKTENASNGDVDEFRLYTAKLSLEVLKPIIAPFLKELKATIADSATGTLNMSELDWTPPIYTEAAKGGKNWMITDNAADITLNFDTAFSATSFAVTGAQNITLTKANDVDVTATTNDFSNVQGKVTVNYSTGAAVVKAGSDTVLTQAGSGTITIANGKKATAPTSWTGTKTPSAGGTLVLKGGGARNYDADMAAGATVELAGDTAYTFNNNTRLTVKGTLRLSAPASTSTGDEIGMMDGTRLDIVNGGTFTIKGRFGMGWGANNQTMAINVNGGELASDGNGYIYACNTYSGNTFNLNVSGGTASAVFGPYSGGVANNRANINVSGGAFAPTAIGTSNGSTVTPGAEISGTIPSNKGVQMTMTGGEFRMPAIVPSWLPVNVTSGTGALTVQSTVSEAVQLRSTVTVSSGATATVSSANGVTAANVVNNGTFQLVDGALTVKAYSGSGTLVIPAEKTLTVDASFAGDTFTVGTLDNLGTLDLSATSVSKLALTDVTNLGTIRWPGGGTGEIVLSGGASRDFTAITAKVVGFEGTVSYAAIETPEEFGHGEFNATGLRANATITVTRPNGETFQATADAEGAVASEHPAEIAGPACLFDITFTNKTDAGGKTGTFSYKRVDASLQFDENVVFTNAPAGSEAPTKDMAVFIRTCPYINGAASTFASLTKFTTVVVGTLSPTANTMFIHFGSSDGGRDGLFLSSMDVADKVLLGWNDGATTHAISELSVVNSSTARHVYVITKEDVEVGGEPKSKIEVFVDGKKRDSQVIDRLSLGDSGHSGVQVGADFGGKLRYSGSICQKVQNLETETGYMNAIRIYDYALSDDQVTKLKDYYPYVSAGGLFTRTIAGTANLKDTGAWAKEGTAETFDLPVGSTEKGVFYKPSATITASSAATLTVNENLELDSLTMIGEATTFEAAAGKALVVSGDAEIQSTVTVKPGSVNLGGTPITLKGDGSVLFDYSNYDVSGITSETVVPLTGLLSEDYGSTRVACTLPTAATHVYTYTYSTSGCTLTVTPNHTAGDIFYISGNFASDGNLVYKLATGTPATLLPGDTVVISNTMTEATSATIASTSPVTQYKFAKDFTLSASSAEAVLGGATVTTLAETTLTLKAADEIAMSIAATTLNGGTVKLDGVTVAGNIGGTSAVVVETEKSVTANANISAPVSGAGTITIASSLPSLNLQANAWTGTVVIPEIEGKGVNLNNWGKTGSTIQINGITDGWLAQAGISVAPALTMNGVFFITAMSPWDYTLAKVSGSGPISFSTSNEQPTSITLSNVTDYTGVVTNLTTATLYVGGTVSATAKFMVDGRGSFDFTAATLTDGATYAFDITKIQEGDRPFNFSSAQSLAYKQVTVIGTSETLMYDTSTGTVVAKPTGGLTGLHIVNMMPKPTSRIEDRDPNGRESGWIRLYNYGPEEVNLKDYKIVRTNLGKEYKTNVSNLVDRAVAANEFAIVYTSEDYPTAEDYGGNGKRVATYAKNGEGKVVEDPNGIIIVPTKVNPKKYPMVRLVKGKDIIDEIIVPCDIDDNMQIEVVPNATKLERKVVYVDGTKAEYGPGVNSLYGIDGVKGDLKLLNKAKFAKVNADYTVVLPVNPFMTNGVALADNEITRVDLEYRVFDPDTMTTNTVENLAKSVADTAKLAETYGTNCCLYTGTIPASAMQAGKLVQFRAKITDATGKVWTAPSFLNPDIGYEWYGVVAQPETTSDPLETSKVCTDRLQTFLMFGERVVVGTDNMGGMMDKDIDDKTMTLPYGARVGIYDIENKTYYDNVRIDLRGQTSKSFYKKSHGLRFNKVAPLKITNPFTGEEYETRKTSFIAEYGDPMYLRQTLALQVMRTAGVKAPFDWPVRVYCNGTYYQLAFHSSRFSDEAVTDFYGLNAYGYSYKNVEQMRTDNNAAEKKTPDDDNEKDLTVLREYQQRVATTDATALTSEAKLRFNIPAWINYLAATRVTQEADDVWTNLGIYINKYDYFHNPNGDDTIMPLAYDQNLSFGQWYYADHTSRGRSGIVANVDTMKSHPFYGGEAIRYTDSSLVADRYNRAMNAILTNEKYREALARRLRTLMDVYFGSLNASKEDTPIWDWVVSYTNAISGDVAVDHQVWKYKEQYLTASNIWVWDTALDFGPAIDDLWDNYIVPRRQHLYGTHSITNTAKEIGYGPALNAGIPNVQTATATLASGISITKSDGTKIITGETTVTDGIVGIENTNAEAIDMSYWKIDGVATHIFAPGTVLPAAKDSVPGKLWIVLDRRAAETQTAIAGSGTPMIVNVDRDAGETISGEAKVSLVDAEGTTVATSQFYMTVGTDPESGKVVAVVTYSDPGTSQTTLPMDWMVEHGIDTTGNEFQLSTNMNVKIEGGNDATPWESYALGLAPEDPTSKPVITPVQTTSPTTVNFMLTNVDGAGAATKNFTVTYKVKAGTTPGGSDIETSEAVDYNVEKTMNLPTDGVRYYTLEVITTPAK